MNIDSTRLKERALKEGKRFAVWFLYLWALLGVLQIHQFLILKTAGPDFGFRFGFAFLKALVLAKLMLIAEALWVPKSLREQPPLYSVFFKSAGYSLILVGMDTLEELIAGVLHGKSLSQSLPPIVGGHLLSLLLVVVVAFVLLLPLFAFTELGNALGLDEGELLGVLLNKQGRPAPFMVPRPVAEKPERSSPPGRVGSR